MFLLSAKQHVWLMHLKGTPPYTSGEVLLNERYYDHQDIVFHDAMYDVESLLWVLIHMCITQQKPGGVHQEELEQKNQANEEYNGLRRVVYFLFNSDIDTMATNKRESSSIPTILNNMFWTISMVISCH